MRGQVRLIVLVVGAVIGLAAVAESVKPVQAMPPFAQAYGMNCEICHSVVPALNSYGRYVQRTNYASLDATTIHHVNPMWVAESPFYDSQDPAEPHKVQWGNVALHAAGYIGSDFTFHFHQWFWQKDQPGGTDTAWVTYNNLFHRDGHLSVGKIESPGPSLFSQTFDLSAFAPPELAVGDHTYQMDGNRWGTKLDYAHGWLFASAAYLGNNADINTATDFSSADIDKTFQWRLAYERPDRPIEVGVVGAYGVVAISDGSFDHYNATELYAQVDPQRGIPGVFLLYHGGHDDNPAPMAGPAFSKGLTEELYEPFNLFGTQALISARNEFTDDGLGTTMHSGNVDLGVVVWRRVRAANTNALIANGEAGMAQGSTPAWRAQLWYVTTISPLHQ